MFPALSITALFSARAGKFIDLFMEVMCKSCFCLSSSFPSIYPSAMVPWLGDIHTFLFSSRHFLWSLEVLAILLSSINTKISSVIQSYFCCLLLGLKYSLHGSIIADLKLLHMSSGFMVQAYIHTRICIVVSYYVPVFLFYHNIVYLIFHYMLRVILWLSYTGGAWGVWKAY